MKRLTGNTFNVKAAMKSLGGKWNAEAKAWEFADEKRFAQAEFIVEAQSNFVKIETGGVAKTVDLSRQIWCSCEKHLPEREREEFSYEGNRVFRHKCGKMVRVVNQTPRQARKYSGSSGCSCTQSCCRPHCECDRKSWACNCLGGNVYDC